MALVWEGDDDDGEGRSGTGGGRGSQLLMVSWVCRLSGAFYGHKLPPKSRDR